MSEKINKYNTKLSQLAGLVTAFASEIENDTDLKSGEKFLLLQRFMVDINKVIKTYEKSKKSLESFAKENLKDLGDGKSQEIDFEGANIFVKYSYPKPSLNAEKLKVDLENAFAEIGTEFKESEYLKESTLRQSVVIQSILEK